MACVKRKFYSKKEAKAFMKVENLKYRDESPLTMVYECLDCHFWHVTHKDKDQARDKSTTAGYMKVKQTQNWRYFDEEQKVISLKSNPQT